MPASLPIPPVFLQRMEGFLQEQYPAFLEALSAEPVSALRVNMLKLSIGRFQSLSPFPLGERIPWAQSAFLLPPQVQQPGLHPYHQAGLYYLQDPSAMAAVTLLDPRPGERILDLAAAPGGKATAMAALMQGQGLLVANEIKDKRVGHLVMNMERWGASNVVITNENPERLADHFGPFFDKVLVDAPCSGEGMFRKDPGSRSDWSLEMVRGCALRQQNILRVAARLVRPGGTLLYSTCTFAPEENEGVVLDFLQEFPGFEVSPLPRRAGFLPGQPAWLEAGASDSAPMASLVGAVRLFPHLSIGEGHFICAMKRCGSELPSNNKGHRSRAGDLVLSAMNAGQRERWQAFCEQVLETSWEADRLLVRGERLYLVPGDLPDIGVLRVVHPGIWLGTFKKNRFEPAHPLALLLDASRVKQVIDFSPHDLNLASYLRGEPFQNPEVSGWALVCVDGFGLGWGKAVQGMVKNHLPRGWIQPGSGAGAFVMS